jgi:hypothetical protein
MYQVDATEIDKAPEQWHVSFQAPTITEPKLSRLKISEIILLKIDEGCVLKVLHYPG